MFIARQLQLTLTVKRIGTGAKRLIQCALTGPLVGISRFAPVPLLQTAPESFGTALYKHLTPTGVKHERKKPNLISYLRVLEALESTTGTAICVA